MLCRALSDVFSDVNVHAISCCNVLAASIVDYFVFGVDPSVFLGEVVIRRPLSKAEEALGVRFIWSIN